MTTNDNQHSDAFLTKLQHLLRGPNKTWRAGKTSVSDLTEQQKKMYLGCTDEDDEFTFEEARRIAKDNYKKYVETKDTLKANYPESFDLRNIGGRNFVTSVKVQGNCQSCVAFGTTATVETAARRFADIAVNDPGGDTVEDLSEAQLFFCNNRVCNIPWSLPPAMNYCQNTGLATKKCFPYEDHDMSCQLCAAWQSQLTLTRDHHVITDISQMKQWLSTMGPLVARFDVYNDFVHYTDGVYHYEDGPLLGGHAVCCVGYSETLQAWLMKNSWGNGWGENGYFWIRYGECGIDAFMMAIDSFSQIYPLYNDMFMRDHLADVGKAPSGSGAYYHSPDIIPVGPTPLSDPQTQLRSTWWRDSGKSLSANQNNFIYVRGKNLGLNAQNGEIHLYWSKASLLLQPSLWKQHSLKTSLGKDSAAVSASKFSEIVIGDAPFQWVPESINQEDHYCLIGRVVTPAHPNPIPEDGDIEDFAHWVHSSPNISWRNVSIVNTEQAPVFQIPVWLQMTNSVRIHIVLNCKNISTDCEVGLQCGVPGFPASLSRTKVSKFPNYTVGTSLQVPANFGGDILVSFWKNGAALQGDVSLSLEAYYSVSKENSLSRFGVDPGVLFDKLLIAEATEPSTDASQQEKIILVGRYEFKLT